MSCFPAGNRLTPGLISSHLRPASGYSPKSQNRSTIASTNRSATSTPARSAQYEKISSKSLLAADEIRYGFTSSPLGPPIVFSRATSLLLPAGLALHGQNNRHNPPV